MENQKDLVKMVENEYDNSGGNLALSREELKTYFGLNEIETDYVIEELGKTEKFLIREKYDWSLEKRIPRLRISYSYARNYWLYEKMSREEADVLIELGQQLWVTFNAKFIHLETENNHLVRLDLRERSLTNIPKKIGIFKHLKVLKLPGNELTQLPESIGNLSKLKILDLDENQIKTLPESIGNLQSLEELYLNQNQLEALPKTIKKLKRLKIIGLDKNEFKTKKKWVKLLKNVPHIHWGIQLPETLEAKKYIITFFVLSENFYTEHLMSSVLRKERVDRSTIRNQMIGIGVGFHVEMLEVRGHKITAKYYLIGKPIKLKRLITQNLIGLIVYDKTEEEEIDWISKIVKEFRKNYNEHSLTAILGLKGENERITTSEGQAKANELGCPYYEIAIDDFSRLDEIIQELVEKVFDPNLIDNNGTNTKLG